MGKPARDAFGAGRLPALARALLLGLHRPPRVRGQRGRVQGDGMAPLTTPTRTKSPRRSGRERKKRFPATRTIRPPIRSGRSYRSSLLRQLLVLTAPLARFPLRFQQPLLRLRERAAEALLVLPAARPVVRGVGPVVLVGGARVEDRRVEVADALAVGEEVLEELRPGRVLVVRPVRAGLDRRQAFFEQRVAGDRAEQRAVDVARLAVADEELDRSSRSGSSGRRHSKSASTCTPP